MSHDDLPPLPSDVTSLLDEERGSAGLSSAARERLRARADLLVPAGIAAGAGALGGKLGATKGILGGKLAIALVAFGVGGATGAAVHAVATSSPSRNESASLVTHVAPPPPADVTSAGNPGAPSASGLTVAELPNATTASARSAGSARPEPTGATPSGNAESTLKRERLSLEVARTAITRGEYGAAIEAIDRHARAFPNGQLAEEREMMRIQALVGQGRAAEARESAARFRRDFPGSMMLGAVDAALRSIP